MKSCTLTLSAVFLLGGCIGTDLVDDPLVGERLEIFPDRIALLIGNSKEAMATYFNEFGVAEEVLVSWNTAPNSIASVDQNGKVLALAPGQSMLFAAHGELKDSVRIAVVLDENAAASVDIDAGKTSLANGESIVLTSIVKNIDDEPITTSVIQWESSNEAVVTVSGNGTVTAVGNGTALVFAIADGVYSNEIEITVGGLRIGSFVSSNGYKASGMATLKVENGDLILELSDNFMTSFALGTFIYLSNANTFGTAVRSEGIEISEVSTNGAHTFNISEKFPNVTLSQYQYVVILCKPASILFGYAQLN